MATALTSSSQHRSTPVPVHTGGSAADAANNTFNNDGTALMVVRTTGTPTTPSISYAITADGNAITARALTAAGATATTVYGPFPPAIYGSNPTISWSSVTGVTVLILQPNS